MHKRMVLFVSVLLVAALMPTTALAGGPGTWTRVTQLVNANLWTPLPASQAALVRNSDGRLLIAHHNCDQRLNFILVNADGSVYSRRNYDTWMTNTNLPQWYRFSSPGLAYVAPTSTSNTDRVFLAVAPYSPLNAAFSGKPLVYYDNRSTFLSGSFDVFDWQTNPTFGDASAGGNCAITVGADRDNVIYAWSTGSTVKAQRWAASGGASSTVAIDEGNTVDYPSLTTDKAGTVYLAWEARSGPATGLKYAEISKTTGEVTGGPWRLTGSGVLGQRASIASRPSGGSYVAYGTGSPINYVRLAKVTSAGPLASSVIAQGSTTKKLITVGAERGSSGRMWVAWVEPYSGGRLAIKARRSNSTVTAWGPVVRVLTPTGITQVNKLAVNGGSGRLDVVANLTGAAIVDHGQYHLQVLPAFAVTASPSYVRPRVKKTVYVKVVDAGKAVSGARVALGSRYVYTNSTGVAKISVGPYPTRRTITFKITKGGYNSASLNYAIK